MARPTARHQAIKRFRRRAEEAVKKQTPERGRVISALLRIYSWPELMRRSGHFVWMANQTGSRVLSAAARLLSDAATEAGRGDGTLTVRKVK
jgi:hypothetical protein